MSSVDEYTKPLEERGLYDAFLDLARDFLPSVTAWQPGEPLRAVGSLMSRWFATAWNTHARPAIRARWLDFATGDWLTIEAWTTYGTLKKSASLAGDTLTVENHGGGSYTGGSAIAPGQITVQNAAGKKFINVSGGNLVSWPGTGPFPTLPDVQFRAVDPGSVSNTPVSGIVTTPVSAPLGVFVQTNTTEWVGQDRQSDASLREEARQAPGLGSVTGPRDAYAYVARRTRRHGGVEPGRLLVTKDTDIAVNVSRVLVRPLGGASLEVWLASPEGSAEGDASTEDTDVYLVNRAYQLLVVPQGFAVSVQAAPELVPAYSLELRIDAAANVSVANAIATSQAALQAWQRVLPIGGRVRAGGSRYVLLDEARRFAGTRYTPETETEPERWIPATGLIEVAVVSGADTPIAYNEVAVGTYTITAVLVSQA